MIDQSNRAGKYMLHIEGFFWIIKYNIYLLYLVFPPTISFNIMVKLQNVMVEIVF